MKVELYADEIMDIAENFSEKLDEIAPLSGTEKQVEWANRIRSKITKNVILCYAFNAKKSFFVEMDEELIKKSERFILSKIKQVSGLKIEKKTTLNFRD